MVPGVSLGSLMTWGARGLGRRNIQGCRNSPQAEGCCLIAWSRRPQRRSASRPVCAVAAPARPRVGHSLACLLCGRCLCAPTRVSTGSLLLCSIAWVAASSTCPWRLRLHRDVTCAPVTSPEVASITGTLEHQPNVSLQAAPPAALPRRRGFFICFRLAELQTEGKQFPEGLVPRCFRCHHALQHLPHRASLMKSSPFLKSCRDKSVGKVSASVFMK